MIPQDASRAGPFGSKFHPVLWLGYRLSASTGLGRGDRLAPTPFVVAPLGGELADADWAWDTSPRSRCSFAGSPDRRRLATEWTVATNFEKLGRTRLVSFFKV